MLAIVIGTGLSVRRRAALWSAAALVLLAAPGRPKPVMPPPGPADGTAELAMIILRGGPGDRLRDGVIRHG